MTAVMLIAVALSAAHAAHAADGTGRIEIDHAGCRNQVGLTATDAMLSDVLQALAAELQFELHFKSDHDRPITVTLQQPARKLIETLGRDDNIMIAGEPDARCDEPADRLRTVWFLGTGPEITYQPVKTPGVDQLPETGELQARSTGRTNVDDREKTKKRRKDMTPEERYLDKLERRERKHRRRLDSE